LESSCGALSDGTVLGMRSFSIQPFSGDNLSLLKELTIHQEPEVIPVSVALSD
jgi:hypothetical protein